MPSRRNDALFASHESAGCRPAGCRKGRFSAIRRKAAQSFCSPRGMKGLVCLIYRRARAATSEQSSV